jgi:RNA polymerase sigma-70 factor, ECF subfamily
VARLHADSGAQQLGVSLEDFTQWSQEAPDPLRLSELILARACATGNPDAWDRFLTLYREKLYAAALAITRDQTRARELADSLYADLYGTRTQPDGSRISKFDSFAGRGSLEGWLKTILAQQHINTLRREKNLVAFDDSRETPPATGAETTSTSNQPALTNAIDAALADLPAEDRFLLASYYLDERTLAEIARMLGVHESTISRRIEKVTATLRKQIVARMQQTGIAKRAAEEMLTVDVRVLEINVREKLAQERRA